MRDKKAIFINTASQIIVRVATLVFALVSIKLLTNYLGTAGTGEYNTITTYINFFIVIADLGLFSVAVREIARKPMEEKKIISNVFTLRLITALVASAIAIVIVYFTEYDRNIKLGTLFAAGFLFFNLLSSVYDVVLQTRLKMQFSALAEFLSKLVSLIALYIIIQNSGSFLLVISTVSFSGILIFFFKWLFSLRYIRFSAKYDAKIINWIFSASWPIGIVFILNNLFFKIDTLLLFAMKGAAAVGIYAVAYKVLEVTIFAGSYFASALKPSLSKYIISDKTKVANILSKSFLIMLFISMPVAVISIVYAKEIILFLSNEEFVSGSGALILLSATLPFVYLDVLLGEILIASDERKLLIKIAVFVLALNLILNFLLIPRYSFMGAALVTLISEIVLVGINIHYTKKIIDYRINYLGSSKILMVSLLTFIFGYFIKSLTSVHFLIQMLILLLVYILFAHSFNLISVKTAKEILKD